MICLRSCQITPFRARGAGTGPADRAAAGPIIHGKDARRCTARSEIHSKI